MFSPCFAMQQLVGETTTFQPVPLGMGAIFWLNLKTATIPKSASALGIGEPFAPPSWTTAESKRALKRGETVIPMTTRMQVTLINILHPIWGSLPVDPQMSILIPGPCLNHGSGDASLHLRPLQAAKRLGKLVRGG